MEFKYVGMFTDEFKFTGESSYYNQRPRKALCEKTILSQTAVQILCTETHYVH